MEDLQKDAGLIQHQIQLLKGIIKWYLFPLALGMGAFVLSVEIADPAASSGFVWFYLAVTGALFGVAYWFNQRVVNQQLLPRKEAIDTLLLDLRSGDPRLEGID
jgi:hypothetical protein